MKLKPIIQNENALNLNVKKTGVTIRKHTLIGQPEFVEHHLLDITDESGEVITEYVFETVKRLLT